MFEHFTERARKVMQLANREAQKWNHEYIGTEHILLGLLDEIAEGGGGVAAGILKVLSVNLQDVRLEMEKLLQSGPEMVTMGRLPQTPRAKKVIEYSMEEARGLDHNYVGTEHLLLGLLKEQESMAGKLLRTGFHLRLANVRVEVEDFLAQRNGQQKQVQDDNLPDARVVVEGLMSSAGIKLEKLPLVLEMMNADTSLRRILVAILRELRFKEDKVADSVTPTETKPT